MQLAGRASRSYLGVVKYSSPRSSPFAPFRGLLPAAFLKQNARDPIKIRITYNVFYLIDLLSGLCHVLQHASQPIHVVGRGLEGVVVLISLPRCGIGRRRVTGRPLLCRKACSYPFFEMRGQAFHRSPSGQLPSRAMSVFRVPFMCLSRKSVLQHPPQKQVHIH